MRRSLLVVVVLAATCAMSFSQSQFPDGPQGTGRIRGRVVAADTGTPLRGASVTVFGEGVPVRETTTGPDGRYEVERLPPGAFHVSASQTGYLGAAYGQARVMEPGTPVTVQDGQTIEGTDLALWRAGAITVRVTDAAGQPLADVRVEVQRFQYRPNGQRRLVNVAMGMRGPATTDDRGEVRAFGLAPGAYVVRATARTIRGTERATAEGPTEGYAPTYYPGATTADQAQAIVLGVGEETTVQFPMSTVPLARVSGRVVTSDGSPASGMQLQIGPGEDLSGTRYGVGTVGADGTFDIGGLPPGVYVLQVRQAVNPRDILSGRSPFDGPRGEFASVPLTLSGADITDLHVVTGAGTTISGRVIFEGTSPLPPTGQLLVMTMPPGYAGGAWAFVGSAGDFPPGSSVDDDGRFRITGASGRIQLDLGAPGWMLKSITLDGDDITDRALDLNGVASISDVLITLTDKVSSVGGQVRGDDGQPVRNYAVVLVPEQEIETEGASRWIHVAQPGLDGRFQIRGVRPGRYVAAALESLEPGRQFAPELHQQIRREARSFGVEDGQTVTLDLTLKPGP